VSTQLDTAPEWTFGPWSAFKRSLFGPPSGAVIKQAAFVRNLTVDLVSPSFYVISDGTREIGFWMHTPQTTTQVARQVSVSKPLTKAVLERAGIRVPTGRVFSRDGVRAGWRYARSIGLPVVVKRSAGEGGSGVTSEIQTEEHFRLAWQSATEASVRERVVVEKHVPGGDFRLYLVGNRMVSATLRIPAYLDGDGRSSISELVEKKNASRRSNPFVGGKTMKLTPVMLRNLAQMGLGPDSVLESGRRVTLHPVASMGTGGESVDVTDDVHPDFREIGVRACEALPGVVNAGVDLLADDISGPADGQEWAVCEVNTCPDIALHHFPVFGKPRDTAGVLIEHLFPGSRECEPSEQRTVGAVLSGKVTGIGFRQWIWYRANLRGLTGWVRNRDASSVEAVFRGAPRAVEDMLRLCRTGPSKAAVADLAVASSTETPTDGFEIHD
jgi:D-alanine-D-alanine ligase-like ATP-grasp enzyme/acylphosphatase